jgi:hypothetical protein
LHRQYKRERGKYAIAVPRVWQLSRQGKLCGIFQIRNRLGIRFALRIGAWIASGADALTIFIII